MHYKLVNPKPNPVPPYYFSFEINSNVLSNQYIGIEVTNGYNPTIKDNIIGINDAGATKVINTGNTYKPTLINNLITGVNLNGNCEATTNNTTGINLTN